MHENYGEFSFNGVHIDINKNVDDYDVATTTLHELNHQELAGNSFVGMLVFLLIYENYRAISDESHIKKIHDLPINFLIKSGKGFFVSTDEVPISLCEELEPLQNNSFFAVQMKDVIEYRTMDYYSRRLAEDS